MAQFETQGQHIEMEIQLDFVRSFASYIFLVIQLTLSDTIGVSLMVSRSYSNTFSDENYIERRNDHIDLSDVRTESRSSRAVCSAEQRKYRNVDEATTYSDTLSQTDAVTKQYLSLPYPSVSEQQLQEEQNHYMGPNRNMPHVTYTTLSLEYLNHFLYQGRNDFK